MNCIGLAEFFFVYTHKCLMLQVSDYVWENFIAETNSVHITCRNATYEF